MASTDMELMLRALTHDRIRIMASNARSGNPCSNADLRQLLTLLRESQERMNTSESLLNWLSETQSSAVYGDLGDWTILSPGMQPITAGRELQCAIQQARDRCQQS